MNQKSLFLTLISVIAVVIVLLSFTGPSHGNDDSADKKDGSGYTFQSVVSPPVPGKLLFAGEAVPLGEYDVFERWDREITVNSFFHSQTIRYIKSAPRYFEIIDPILKKNNIPADFRYLALAESGFDPKALSPSGAAGIWQFMKSAAKENGLEVTEEVDERYNIEKATEAACNYLKDSYETFGNWTLVAASYNTGKNNVIQQINKQEEKLYYDLLLAEETNRYLFRILALKTILESPEKYGFFIEESEKYPSIPFKYVEVSASISDLTVFAKNNGTNFKILKTLNPWLRGTSLNNEMKKSYKIKIPKKK